MFTKPHLTALCCALASMAAQAQSSVQLYGAMDVFVGRQSAGGAGNMSVVNSGFNPNAFGFAGTEDLGSGLKAGFVLEGQPALDTGAFGQGGKMFGRQSLVYLSGDLGRFGMGRQHTPGRTLGVKYSPSGWLSTDAFGNLELAAGSAISAGMNADTVGGRLSNSLSYMSPTWAGISFSAIHSLDEGGLFANGQARMTQLGVAYTSAQFDIDFAASRTPELAGSQIAQQDYGLGLLYKSRIGKFFAVAQVKRGAAVGAAGDTTPIANSWGSDRILGIGAQIPVSDLGTIGISLANLKVAGVHRGRRQANAGAPFSTPVDDATAWSLAYTYALSRRTQLFASYGQLDNASLGTASLVPSFRPTPGGKSSLMAVGVRHAF